MFEAYILIGGRSSRLGRDKAFVDLNGKTLMQRAAEAVRDGLHPDRITAVAGNAARFAIDSAMASIPFIFDLYPDRGPIGGLHAALADAKTPWLFLLACDYPFISPKMIALLATSVTDDFGCVVPEQDDGRMQPLCAFYRVTTTLPVVEKIIARPRVPPPMHEVVAMLRPRVVKFAEYSHLEDAESQFANINTAEDLDRARSG